MDAASLFFGVGDQVRAVGRLVRDADGDWFEPFLPVPAILGPLGPPAPTHEPFAVPVSGADFATLSNRYERDGAIEGGATISGVWRAASVEVLHQSAAVDDSDSEEDGPDWDIPPCPEPVDGWPRGFPGSSEDNLDFDLGDLEVTGAAVSVVIFRPSADQAVLVVAATNIDAVQDQLGPQLPDRLCIVPSRYTKAQVEEVLAHLESVAARWKVHGFGVTCGADAQIRVIIELMRVTDEIVSWHSTQHAGLVDLRPTLRPHEPVDAGGRYG